MEVHTNQGLRERDGSAVGGGCLNSENNRVLLFLSLVPLWQ